MALAYQSRDNALLAERYINALRNAQLKALNANGFGIVSASNDGVTTGFTWEYFNRLHIGATAWYLLAEQGYNPYSQKQSDDNDTGINSGGGFGTIDYWSMLIFLFFYIHRMRCKRIENTIAGRHS